MAMTERLSAYLDNELSPEEMLLLEEELAKNKELNNQLNSLKIVSNQMRIDEQDKEIAAQIKRAIKNRRKYDFRQRRIKQFLIPTGFALAVLLAFAVLPKVKTSSNSIQLSQEDIFNNYAEALLVLED